MTKWLLGGVAAATFFCGLASAHAQCTVPNVFSAGTTALSAQVNANFSALTGCALPESGGTLTNGTLAGTTTLPGSGVITSTGHLGIGTSAPGYPLDVQAVTGSARIGSTTGTNYAYLDFSNTGGYLNFGLDNSSGGGLSVGSSAYAGVINVDGAYPLQFGTSNTVRMTINSSGSVGIGTTSPDTLLTVGSAAPSGNVAHFQNSTGSCYINPTSTSLSCSSDIRLKRNIAPLVADRALAGVLALKPVSYNWRTETAGAPAHIGFVAQEIQKIFPGLVAPGPDGYLTLNYAGFTPYLTKALQQIATISGAFKANLIAWFADASNGIDRLSADTVHVKKLCADTSAGAEICITGDQLAALLAERRTAAVAAGSGASRLK